MGAESEPLFATVSPGLPEDYVITVSELSEEDVRIWRHGGFLDSDKESYTLTEFMNTGYDSHKIMGYLSGVRVSRWLLLFDYLAKKYPALNTIEFHFYYLDEKEPFYFQWKREDIRTHTELLVHVGSNESIYWFIEDPERKHKPYNTLVFQKDMYISNWKKGTFRSYYTKNSTVFSI